MAHDRRDQLTAVAALAEPTRRRLYEHVARQPRPVGRDDVAGALGLPRGTTAFHLDRLVAGGLLAVHFERRSGRTGPGAGRPAKLYRRADAAVAVSLPERHYDLAGDLLAVAISEAEASGERPRAVLERRARERGRELGRSAGGTGPEAVLRVLEEQGYEPRVDGDDVVLANCPFHVLAREHTQLVCGMNLHLLDGLVETAPASGLVPRLQPEDGTCCVRLATDQDRHAVAR